MGKKKKKGRKKTEKRLERLLSDGEVLTHQDLVYAGLGLLVQAANDKKPKRFWKRHKRGLKAQELGISVIDELLSGREEQSDLVEPVIAYRHQGGGWFDIEVGDVVVDRVQGEADAAERAGELLEQAASTNSRHRGDDKLGPVATGGGWYEVYVSGVPIEKVQGRESADEVMARIDELNRPG